jgi:hypothetical protein
VVYQIQDRVLIVLDVLIADRKEACRDFSKIIAHSYRTIFSVSCGDTKPAIMTNDSIPLVCA